MGVLYSKITLRGENMKEKTAQLISLRASNEEIAKIELIKEHYCRSSNSDMIRFLIHQEAEKILTKNTPIGVIDKNRESK